jgi:quercetin dioxygenase-like cupin family protein
MTLHDWNAIPVEAMNPRFSRRVVHTPHLTIARLDLLAGAHVPEHAHPNEQISMVEHGLLRFHLGGQEVLVGPGQTIEIPPNLPHSVDVLEDSAVTDLFAPPRHDWMRGDDAYLRGGNPVTPPSAG